MPARSINRPTGDEQESERRDVTVVFVDASNFTAASHRIDSEDVFHFVDEAMRLLVDVVSQYDGTVDKFTGDGLMALFGAPIAHENDAERAVQAAWEMQRVLKPFRTRVSAQHDFEFRIRIGVNTGEVVAGRIGGNVHAEYTVIGDTVNLASRLQTAAQPDQVLVSSSTHALTSWAFEYEELPPLELKGISHQVTAYRLIGPQRRKLSARGIPGVAIPMIGRDAPLADVRSAVRETIDKRNMRTVAITGEAGVGKTRLVHEFMRSPEAAAARVIEAKCLPFSRSRPLSLIADVIRALCGIEMNDPEPLQISALRAVLGRLPAQETDLLPYLASILELKSVGSEASEPFAAFDESMLQQQTHAAVRQIIVAEASVARLVIILDDLHWADAASLDCVEYLLRSMQDEPLVVMLISRIAERSTRLLPLFTLATADAEHSRDIILQPLDAHQSGLLLRNVIPGDAPDLVLLRRKIAGRAEGNPFYMEELIRMLIDRGALAGIAGSWVVAPDAHELLDDVPASLRGLILARFDALPRKLHRFLQQAAVLGRSFPIRLLRQLTGATEEAVAKAFDELETRGFLVQESFGLERGYTFSHSLVQKAIHRTLLRRDRQELHARVADVVMNGAYIPAPEKNEILAYHFSESAEPQRAIPYLLATAEYAARRFSNESAIDLCRRALEIMRSCSVAEDTSEAVRIRLTLARAQKLVGKLADARETLKEALDRLRVTLTVEADVTRVAIMVDILRELADVKSREGLLDEAYSHLEEAALAIAEWPEADKERVAPVLSERMAWVRFRQGRLDDALVIADKLARTLSSESSPDRATLASVYNTLGGVLWQYGKLDAAVGYVRESLSMYHKIGYLFGKANAHTNLGVLYYAQGRWIDAAQNFERSDWIRREIGCMVGRAGNLQNLALLRIALGQHDQARREFETSVRVSHSLGEEYDEIRSMLGLAYLAVVQERFDEAAELLKQIDKSRKELDDDDRAQKEWLRALVLASRSSVGDAVNVAADACRIARDGGVLETQADCARVHGLLLIRAGEQAEGDKCLGESLQLATKVGDPYRQALALLEIGKLQTDTAERRTRIDEAMRIFTELGAVFDLNRALRAADASAPQLPPLDTLGAPPKRISH